MADACTLTALTTPKTRFREEKKRGKRYTYDEWTHESYFTASPRWRFLCVEINPNEKWGTFKGSTRQYYRVNTNVTVLSETETQMELLVTWEIETKNKKTTHVVHMGTQCFYPKETDGYFWDESENKLEQRIHRAFSFTGYWGNSLVLQELKRAIDRGSMPDILTIQGHMEAIKGRE